MGHLNGILARVGGNLNSNFQKSQMPGGVPGGGMLKLRFDRYIKAMQERNICSRGVVILAELESFRYYKGLSIIFLKFLDAI